MKRIITFIVIIISFIACQKEPIETVYFNFENQAGVFIVNEGNFMHGNASLSFFDEEENRAYHQIFNARNKAPLGDVAQSMVLKNGLAWVVINNSGKIYVADANTMEFRATVTGLSSPRYIHFVSDDKAYVSDLYSQSIHIIDPNTYQKSGEISLSENGEKHSSEQLISYEEFVFTNSWSNDNKILIINSLTDQLVGSITVPVQPQSMVLDKNNKLWVLCDGGYEGHPLYWEKPALVRIDAATREVEKLFFFDINDNPSSLEINGTRDQLYFINKDVYTMAAEESVFPISPIIESPYPNNEGGFYALGIDPISSNIYVADAIDYHQNGIIYRYSSEGILQEEFKTGVNPSFFCFKED